MQTGDQVRCTYKTGKYIGRIHELRRDGVQAVVEILAVDRHPIQGDLHQPNKTDVPLFHERKALSFREKANIPLKQIKPHEGEIPEYDRSLQEAVAAYEQELEEKDSAFAEACLQTLHRVKADYRIS
ncbi:kinase-associated lipoprotein B [Alkalicoccus chagannorensis]|uniref:kinase-associated lipoprotein B n=1 Tax=Alkalicoccus chagannorensis TaxID=427072 RepID=UPI000417CE87|nr:kinase-associated lipoprotein B [Alkalicoccus chagannorensis]